MTKFGVYRVLLNHLAKSEEVWAGSMVLFVSSCFRHDMNRCVLLAEKLGTRYPIFAKKMYDNWGISQIRP
jgi:hypothetical protein